MSTQAPTPETDEQINGKPCTRFAIMAGDGLRDALVPSEFARKLERERDVEREMKYLGFETIRRVLGITGEHTWEELIAEIQDVILTKDAQILALREALEAEQSWREIDGVESDKMRIKAGLLREKALSSPAPEVVPLSKLQDAEADAERLASKFKAYHEALTKPGDSKTSWQEVKRTGQEMDEALAAHEARKRHLEEPIEL